MTTQSYTKTMQDRGEWPSEKNVGRFERFASAGAGVALTAFAMVHRGGLGMLEAMLGAGLIVRGVTGRCQVYRALQRSTATSAHIDHGLRDAPTAEEARLDDMLDDSFPASDPPSFTPAGV